MHSPTFVAPVADALQRRSRAQTAGYFAAFVSLGLVSASLGPTLPDLARQTSTDLGTISFLFTTRSLGYLIGSFWGGRMYDRMPGHPIFTVCLLAMALLLGLAPVISLLWLLTAALMLLGIAEGFLDVGGNTLLVWLHRERVGPLLNGLHFGFGFGAFLTPIIIAQTVLRIGWYGWAYWLIALTLLPLALAFTRLSSPAAPQVAADALPKPINWPLVGLLTLFFMLYVAVEVSFGGWIFTYAVRLNLYPETTAAYLVSAFWGALTIGRLLAIPLATRLRPRTILFGDLLGGILSVICIIVWPQSHLALWIGTIGIGLSVASIFPTALAFAERRMVLSGQITSLFLVGSSLGAMILPWVIGLLFEQYGPSITMFLVLAALVLACVVFAILLRIAPAPEPIIPNLI